MSQTIIAIPAFTNDDITGKISDHFGHSKFFALCKTDENQITETNFVANDLHDEGGCMAVVSYLKKQGVSVIVAKSMGARPLSALVQAGIEVFHSGKAETIYNVMSEYLNNRLLPFGKDLTCSHGGEHHHNNHHHNHHNHH